ncbi:MAG: dTMP kinase [Lactobacillaceae bacterium]
MLVAFEGIDGAGKSTVFDRIKEETSNTNLGNQLVFTREPGGTRISEDIRRLIISPDYETMDPKTETLLYAAARRQNLIEKIIPALDANKVVLADRFIDSSLVYQGIGRNIGIQVVAKINQFVLGNVMPDRVIYFDISPQEAVNRLKKRKQAADRFEKENIQFFEQLSLGYHNLISKNPAHYVVIDAQKSPQKVYESVKEVLIPLIKEALK